MSAPLKEATSNIWWRNWFMSWKTCKGKLLKQCRHLWKRRQVRYRMRDELETVDSTVLRQVEYQNSWYICKTLVIPTKDVSRECLRMSIYIPLCKIAPHMSSKPYCSQCDSNHFSVNQPSFPFTVSPNVFWGHDGSDENMTMKLLYWCWWGW